MGGYEVVRNGRSRCPTPTSRMTAGRGDPAPECGRRARTSSGPSSAVRLSCRPARSRGRSPDCSHLAARTPADGRTRANDPGYKLRRHHIVAVDRDGKTIVEWLQQDSLRAETVIALIDGRPATWHRRLPALERFAMPRAKSGQESGRSFVSRREFETLAHRVLALERRSRVASPKASAPRSAASLIAEFERKSLILDEWRLRKDVERERTIREQDPDAWRRLNAERIDRNRATAMLNERLRAAECRPMSLEMSLTQRERKLQRLMARNEAETATGEAPRDPIPGKAARYATRNSPARRTRS